MAKKSTLTNKTNDYLVGASVLIIISGGVSAYKSLELIRLLKKSGIKTPVILTNGGSQFITPLSVSALSGEPVYTDLFSLKDEQEMGHIRLSRESDLIVVVPASANMMARTAHGMADDLASTVLLAANKNIQLYPAMNPEMWANQATKNNVRTLKNRGIDVIEPDSGEVACGETGKGRLPEIESIYNKIIQKLLSIKGQLPLCGKSAIVTAGPTYEAIDPVRFIGNRSSGKQGYAIAEKLAAQGADVTLISGPTALNTPHGIKRVNIESAEEMYNTVEKLLPCDIAVCCAAVADWRVDNISPHKFKKQNNQNTPELRLTENKDILKHIANHKTKRPHTVIGFAAETDNLEKNARDKFKRKGCDALLANQINAKQSVFGADENTVLYISQSARENKTQVENWPTNSKTGVADMLVSKIIQHLENDPSLTHTEEILTKLEAI